MKKANIENINRRKAMKIALIGYGKMGHVIEKIAQSRGHEIALIVDENNRDNITDAQLKEVDVAIEFTVPSVATDNYKWCFRCGVPVVSGTTGWLEKWEEVTQVCQQANGGFFYASNFSVGVNIFFHLNKYLAKVMSRFNNYEVILEETHHIHKLDAPSGTAITIAEGILDNTPELNKWELVDKNPAEEGNLPIIAHREGEVPGIHSVTYKSHEDEIQIYHSAFSRQGFALGAVLAAEYMNGKSGVFGMEDLLQIED